MIQPSDQPTRQERRAAERANNYWSPTWTTWRANPEHVGAGVRTKRMQKRAARGLNHFGEERPLYRGN